MAKMHSRKRGKSGSKKPLKPTKPAWIRYQPKEIEHVIVKLAKEGKTAAQIGLALRDQYGIPDTKLLVQKTIHQVLQEKNLAPQVPEDLASLIKRVAVIKKHRETHKKDNTSLRGMQLTESKIKRLVKYYKREGKLPQDWKYGEDKIRLFT